EPVSPIARSSTAAALPLVWTGEPEPTSITLTSVLSVVLKTVPTAAAPDAGSAVELATTACTTPPSSVASIGFGPLLRLRSPASCTVSVASRFVEPRNGFVYHSGVDLLTSAPLSGYCDG